MRELNAVWRAGVLVCVGILGLGGSAHAQTSVAGCVGTTAASGPCISLTQQIGTLLASPAAARAHWGIDVVGMDGTAIYSLNEGQLFQPASNAKLFTTTAALSLLGGDTRFQTKVMAEGKVSAKGVLTGNLSLVGGGDASFGSAGVPYVEPLDRPKEAPELPGKIADIEELADAIVAKGIERIDGDIVGDDQRFAWEPYPDNWAWDDLTWAYGAPVSALMIHDNAIDVSIAATRAMKAQVHLAPDVSYYTIESRVTAVKGLRGCERLSYYRALGSKTLQLGGDVSATGKTCLERIAIQDPAEYAARALKKALEQRGVHITGTARALHRQGSDDNETLKKIDETMSSPQAQPACMATATDAEATELAAKRSPTVMEDIHYMNKVSQNQHAEVLLRNLGAAMNCGSSQKVSLHVLRQWLVQAGLDKDDFAFYDGSGLSGHDLVTPRATVKLLQYAVAQPWFADWKMSLPVGGVDGSLQERFAKAPLAGHIFAKTGTLGEARALSGYLDCASGRTVIFTIMVGNHTPGSGADRDVMDKIVAAIAAAN